MSPLTSLRYYLSAWKRHNIFFGLNGAPHSPAHTIYQAFCTEIAADRFSSVEADRLGPDDAVRVADESMVYRFSFRHEDPRKRGERNPDFLNAARLQDMIGRFSFSGRTLIFPVSSVYQTEMLNLNGFMRKAGHFLAELTPGGRYAVEVSNREFLFPQYFELLARYDVAHVLHDSGPMPSLLDQAQQLLVFPGRYAVVRTKASLLPEWQLGLIEIIRRCINERKKLLVFLEEGKQCPIEASLHTLMEMLSHDLGRLSPLRRVAA